MDEERAYQIWELFEMCQAECDIADLRRVIFQVFEFFFQLESRF